jgi:ABC-type bacteriocin/lantibiotic exporter with double-glycine peptidase domain
MDSRALEQIVIKLAELSKQKYNLLDLKDKYSDVKSYEADDFGLLINDITEIAQRAGLILVSNKMNRGDLKQFVERAEYPILVFKVKEKVEPLLIYLDKDDEVKCLSYTGKEPVLLNDPAGQIPYLSSGLETENGQDKVFFLTIYPLYTLVSELKDSKNKGDEAKALTPVRRFLRLLGTEKRDITYIYVYAIATGIINLSLPLGIQAIIGLISGGLVFSSVIVLISIVIVGVLISGALQVMQLTLVEILQRRVFTKAAFEFAFRIPRITSESLLKFYPPELMNRFFDVTTVQKGLPKVLIEVTASLLQILFGLMLLAFYHPFFIAFGLILLFILFLIFYFTWERGLSTSLVESKYKYKVAHWLEEIARTITSFKLAGHTNLPIQKTDSYVNKYLFYRKSHFKVLLTQFINIVAFKTLIIGSVLALGTFLVVDRQITLGQFVASEIVIVIVLSNVEKIILSLDVIYDLLTGLEKIGNVTDLPLERNNGIKTGLNDNEKGIEVKVKDLWYTYPETTKAALKGVNFDIKPGERVCLAGTNGSGKDTLIKVLSGVLESFKGIVTLNGISMRDVHLATLRDSIDKNVSQEDIFEGSILDNIIMGRNYVKYKDVLWAIENLGLSDTLNALPEGLHTEVAAGGKTLSGSAISKITLARCVAARPKLLIVNDYFQFIERREKLEITSFLYDRKNNWSLFCISNDPIMMAAADKIIILKDGQVAVQGSFDEVKSEMAFKEVLYA